ncbi:hypothetical protein K7I13_04785 [Brucepastera parasyntrophica]|uniref:hypothetical protein n=1 Tax=Brucepastera parasyntrophica TaxID=2880008 RepID=UPI00210F1DF6|nr:hypothetical protein [Brucepastera parasyntrophica]ULQ60600.1 hypothetical protein K7I13_04785 [Brucepastera parasyntrophica]
MPYKLILFVIILVFAAFFIGYNLENSCSVSVVFHTFKDVPVYLSVLLAFIAGTLCSIPFFIGFRKNNHSDTVRRDQKPSGTSPLPPGKKPAEQNPGTPGPKEVK